MKTLWNLFLTSRPTTQLLSNLSVLFGIVAVWQTRYVSINTLVFEIALYFLFYGSIYQMNEVFDYERDRQDPVRQLRPLASGKVTRKQVAISATVGLFISLFGLLYLCPVAAPYLIGMWLLNVSYVTILKKYPYFDIIIVSFTHLLKFFFGIVITSATPFTFGLFWTGIAAYCVAVVSQGVKKIGRIDDSDNPHALSGKRQGYVIVRYIFLALMVVSLLLSSPQAHVLLWIMWIVLMLFVLLTDISPQMRLLYASVHRKYSTL